MSSIVYSLHENNQTIAPDLLAVLEEVDHDFQPALHTWVDLNAYAHKMAGNAVCWVAHHEDKPIAFAACYVNQTPSMSFWTMLAIKRDFRNRMIGLLWEPQIIRYCREKGSAGILAEVDSKQQDLIALHTHFGFVQQPLIISPDGRSIVPMALVF